MADHEDAPTGQKTEKLDPAADEKRLDEVQQHIEDARNHASRDHLIEKQDPASKKGWDSEPA
jgi:hypothetical protein